MAKGKASVIGEQLQQYIDNLVAEQESLAAKFIAETGLKPSEIVLCEEPLKSSEGYGRAFYYKRQSDFKRVDFELTDEEKRRVKKLRNMNTTESEAFLLDLLERAGVIE